MNEPEFNLQDEINTQLDARKLQQLVDAGIITLHELESADIVMLVCPNDRDHGLTIDGTLCEVCKVEPIVVRDE